jgi:drug/metabolite transporter (DMT)-like permease
MAFGAIFFNEVPDKYTLLGAGIIVISGLYAFIREAKLNTTSLNIND